MPYISSPRPVDALKSTDEHRKLTNTVDSPKGALGDSRE